MIQTAVAQSESVARWPSVHVIVIFPRFAFFALERLVAGFLQCAFYTTAPKGE